MMTFQLCHINTVPGDVFKDGTSHVLTSGLQTLMLISLPQVICRTDLPRITQQGM